MTGVDEAAARAVLRALFAAAVAAVSADACMPARLPPCRGRRVVIAAGKAAAAMMQVAEARADAPLTGLVVTRAGHWPPGWPAAGSAIVTIEAGHPVPDAQSVHAAHRALALAGGLGVDDALLVLLSGGGSALLAAPVAGVSLADKQAVTRALLHSGAPIAEVNLVRRQLSAIKNGGLAAAAAAAEVTSWIISDVPGDDPARVASGPTIADGSTPADARAIVARYGLALPASVTAALSRPAPPAAAQGGTVRILARARDALDAAAGVARAAGYRVVDLGDAVEGEARTVGAAHGALARRLAAEGGRIAILSGGETGVTVRNPAGRGGRNLEYLLGLAIALDGAAGITALAGDSDGIDGTEDAAGAIVTPGTLMRARAAGLDPAAQLDANDACPLFDRIGDLIRTGPTRTNVNDIRAILIG